MVKTFEYFDEPNNQYAIKVPNVVKPANKKMLL